MINKIYYKAALSMIMLLFLFSCNKKESSENDQANDKSASFSSWFGGAEVVDIEDLRNTLAQSIGDSAQARSYLDEMELPSELENYFVSFYRNRNYSPAWTDEGGLTDEGKELLEAISESTAQGLSPEDYKLQYLYELKKKTEARDAPLESFSKLEKEYTLAYLKYANHILKGRMKPKELDALWVTSRRKKDLAAYLQQAQEDEEITASLEALEPNFTAYEDLKSALKKYEEIQEKAGKWKPLPEDLVLKPGDTSEYVMQLAQTLHLLGDLEDKPQNETLYIEPLAAALAGFQERHGLKQDSVVAENTLAMLNIPVKERVKQIKLNLERFRWLPERPEGRHVVVNVPEYKLRIYEGEDSTLSMRVVVGEAYESVTPIFNDSIEYIAFSPTWTVPVSISTEEMLPKLKENPDYLPSRNFKLYESWQEGAAEVNPHDVNWEKVKADDFPYRIVQQPGPNNSLGRVKFMFPNKMSIYLHDTPADYLFERNERDLSHGCIRVEKPVELATYLLQEKEIGEAEVEKNMNLPEPLNTVLPEKVPVFIEYRTAWVGSNGKVHFREDIYGHDQKQINKLEAALASASEF